MDISPLIRNSIYTSILLLKVWSMGQQPQQPGSLLEMLLSQDLLNQNPHFNHTPHPSHVHLSLRSTALGYWWHYL